MRQIFAEREWDKHSLLRLNASNYSGKSVIGRNEGRSLIIQCQRSGKFDCELAEKGSQEEKKRENWPGIALIKLAFLLSKLSQILNPKRGVLKKIGVPAI